MTNPSTPEPIVKYSEEWWSSRSMEVQARRCTGHKKNGDQCGKVAMDAQRVCGTHGGRAPQAKRKARQRLEEAADRMAQRILGIAIDDEVPAAVALSAAKDALDRAGLKPPAQVEVSPRPLAPWEELLRDCIGDVAQISYAQHQAMKRGDPYAPAAASELPPGHDGLEVVNAEPVMDRPETHHDSPGDDAGRCQANASRPQGFATPTEPPYALSQDEARP